MKTEQREQILSLAKESLSEHIIKQELDTTDFKVWLCKSPGKSFYWYRVLCIPGCIIVQGDVGNRLFTMYDKDSLGWIKGAANSPDYVMGKCEDKEKDFIPSQARALIAELRTECKPDDNGEIDTDAVEEQSELSKKADQVEEAWYEESDSYQFSQAWYEAGLDTESISMCYDFNTDVIWSYACLKRFVELLDTQATKV